MSTQADRYFSRGETVNLRALVSEPGTKKPTTATVVLVALKRDTVVVPVDVTTFAQAALGDYRLTLATDDLEPGSYEVVVRVSDGPDKVSLLTDRFALKAL